MKLAKLADLKRALIKRDRTTVPCFVSISLRNLPGFADAAFAPNTHFLAICGGTGVGKTALLELIYTALAPSLGMGGPKPQQRLGDAEIDLVVSPPNDAANYERALRLGDEDAEAEGYDPPVKLVGLADRTSDPQLFFQTNDIEVVKEGAASREFTPDAIALVSLVCRKQYSKVVVYEVEAGPDVLYPFFEITTEHTSYDSRTMATGELSAFHLAWVLSHVAQSSIVLIEEPEAYFPPLSHAAIFGLICQATVSKGLTLIITTHSAEIASEIPQSNLISIRSHGGQSLIPATAESKQRVLSRLGLGPQMNAILFVEDQLAREVLNEIVSKYEFSVSCAVEIIPMPEGAGGVKRALEGLPKGITSFRFFGILDGDMRGAIANWPARDSILFLPFQDAMETEFLSAIEAAPRAFAQKVGRTQQQVEDLLADTQGGNHHDRFNEVAAQLGLSIAAITPICFRQWLARPRHRSATTTFANQLAGKIGISLP